MPNVYLKIFPILTLLLCLACSSGPAGPVSMRTDADVELDTSVQDEFDAAVLADMESADLDMNVDAGCQPIADNEVACDGVDDDCDGVVDEALEQRCYEGPGGSLGNGLCSAGSQQCDNGAWTACIDQVLPGEESCNALDDDCDGTTDEAIFELCDADAVPGVGQCRPAARICSDGMFGECSPPIEPVEELCDGLDNDCDGVVDETFADGDMDGIADCVDDDFDNDGRTNERDNCPLIANDTQRDTDLDGLGDACDADDDGDGFVDGDDCGPLDAARFPDSIETCNGVDDDCDGISDELAEQPCFDGDEALIGIGTCAEGVQTCEGGEWGDCQDSVLPEAELCDGQDQDCDGNIDEGLDPGWPDTDEDGFGDDTRPPVCPAPQNYARVPGDCDDGSRAVFPGAPDVPDRLYRDENCDGVDGTASEMIFANSNAPNFEGDALGTREKPFRQLEPALEAAIDAGVAYIAVGDAASLTVPLVDGISIIGGYNSDEGWVRDPVRQSIIFNDRRVQGLARVYGENLESPITLANLAIRPSSRPTEGESTYGIFIKNAVSVTLYSMLIEAGPGGDGLNGTPGQQGLSGGGAGAGAECGGGGNGGVGGVSMCGDGGRGGNGGRGSNDRGNDGAPEGCGGNGGSGADGGQTGGSGGRGQAGTDGAWGTLGPPAPEPHPTADGWFTGYGGPGGIGESGSAGCGGGGGGGAWWYPNQHGGSGGGGGGAGCGGEGATGGKDGGASIGIFLSNVDEAILEDLLIQTQAGGYGGPGGTGGAGGVGGNGGAGSSGDDWPCNIALGPGYGGEGGRGGNGGRGGDGIGGRGGWSVGIACFNTLPVVTDVGILPGEPGEPLGTNERGQAVFTSGCE